MFLILVFIFNSFITFDHAVYKILINTSKLQMLIICIK